MLDGFRARLLIDKQRPAVVAFETGERKLLIEFYPYNRYRRAPRGNQRIPLSARRCNVGPHLTPPPGAIFRQAGPHVAHRMTGAGVPSDQEGAGTMITLIASAEAWNCGFSITGEPG